MVGRISFNLDEDKYLIHHQYLSRPIHLRIINNNSNIEKQLRKCQNISLSTHTTQRYYTKFVKQLKGK